MSKKIMVSDPSETKKFKSKYVNIYKKNYHYTRLWLAQNAILGLIMLHRHLWLLITFLFQLFCWALATECIFFLKQNIFLKDNLWDKSLYKSWCSHCIWWCHQLVQIFFNQTTEMERKRRTVIWDKLSQYACICLNSIHYTRFCRSH